MKVPQRASVRFALFTVVFIVSGLLVASSFGLHRQLISSFSSGSKPQQLDSGELPTIECSPSGEKWRSSSFVLGPAKEHFFENLRNDTHYITSWSNAGFTNQFISYVNMIYLGLISDRVPIIPPFAPEDHIPSEAGIIPFGDLFNLTELRVALRRPILEWRDVKKLPPSFPKQGVYSTQNIDHLGCWSTRSDDHAEPNPAYNLLTHLGLDASYTRIPSNARINDNRGEAHALYYALAALIFPDKPGVDPNGYPLLSESKSGLRLVPDTHIACFDFLYYMTSNRVSYEWQHSWSPAWRFVGRHLFFTEALRGLGERYLTKLFNTQVFPPFVAVHFRRGDFGYECMDREDLHIDECLGSLQRYVDMVKEVQEELWNKHGINASTVIAASDDESASFWNDIDNLGWKHINHTEERTEEKYGSWYPPLVDIVTQSYAHGFVGTGGSTFSLVTQRRVEDWNNGVTRTITANRH